jgi:hypothetical protein
MYHKSSVSLTGSKNQIVSFPLSYSSEAKTSENEQYGAKFTQRFYPSTGADNK